MSVCPCKKIYIYIYVCIYRTSTLTSDFGMTEILSPPVLLTEFSDSTVFFLNWVLNSFYFTEEIKLLADGQPRPLQAVITSHTHLSLQIRKYNWRAAFPPALFLFPLPVNRWCLTDIPSSSPSSLLPFQGVALLSYFREGKWKFWRCTPAPCKRECSISLHK